MAARPDKRPILKFNVDRLTLPYKWCAGCGVSAEGDDDSILRAHVRFADTCTSIIEVQINVQTAQFDGDPEEPEVLRVRPEHLLAAIQTPVQIRSGRLEVVANADFMRAAHALIARAASRHRQSED